MFTGIVRDIGKVLHLTRNSQGVELVLRTPLAALLAQGDSIAVNGVCLTASTLGPGEVTATVVPETLQRSTLGGLREGSAVNLEPALRAGEALGGHLVQGHVDGMGKVRAFERSAATGVRLTIQPPTELLRYVVEKGSITIDGVSLTVASLGDDEFSVALVPHTLEATTLGAKTSGDRVNLEVDIVAKYIERLTEGYLVPRHDAYAALTGQR